MAFCFASFSAASNPSFTGSICFSRRSFVSFSAFVLLSSGEVDMVFFCGALAFYDMVVSRF